jgi:hypothetical protein
MIYGRRFFQHKTREGFHSKRFGVLDSNFQYRYVLYLLLSVGGSASLFLAASSYFVSDNYEILKNLSYDLQPDLLYHLEKEVFWLYGFMWVGILSVLFFVGFIGFNLTKKLSHPLLVIENHLKKLSQGHWNIPQLEIHEESEFKEALDSYNYFYKSLQANAESEIKLLEKISVDPNNREAYMAWQSLIQKKRMMLGIEGLSNSAPIKHEVETSEVSVSARTSRPAA